MATTKDFLSQCESQITSIKQTDHKNDAEQYKTSIKALRSILQQIREKLNESINSKSLSGTEEEKLRSLLDGAQELEGDLTVQLVKLVSPFSRELTVESVEILLNNTHIVKPPESHPPTATNNNNPPTTQTQTTPPPQPKAIPPSPITSSQSSSSSSSPSHNEDADGPPEIDRSEIIYDEQRDFLGQGSFGKVYRGICRGKRVAVKVPSKQNLSQKELDEFRMEMKIMKKLSHPNIILFMGSCTASGQIQIVTEIMYTDMDRLLKSQRPLTIYQRLKLAKDAALGMNWLHGILNIIHRDLKPANLLVDENLTTVKITDFGFSQLKPSVGFIESKGVARGTPLWMAPEILMGQAFNEKCDVYSFGIILWQFITRKDPYENHTDFKTFRRSVCKYGERPDIPGDTLPSLKSLIERCWQHDFNERPSFKDIVYNLDEIIVDSIVAAPEARKFWKDNFLAQKKDLQETVPWTEFLQKLFYSLGLLTPANGNDSDSEDDKKLVVPKPQVNPDTWKKLKDLLAEKSVDQSQSVITLNRFSQSIIWFGCFFLPVPRSFKVLSEIRALMDKEWFHGDISKEEAERRLLQRPHGTFLMRLSTTTPEFPFTISMLDNQHRRIQFNVTQEAYSFKGSKHSYPTLVDLVENCKDSDIADLRYACPKTSLSATWGYT
mmetsp:Transcript_4789/g.6690  ORF Transcript_4789/g.6690 Transcript_4789/m.6690 type:complete len:664 (+) Transcript_4789:78-2069(+)